MTDTPLPSIRRTLSKRKASESIGFGFVPDQIRKRSIDDGFQLNILIIGRRGLGSSTFINSLFHSPLVIQERSNEMNTYVNEIYEADICLRTSITTYHGKDLNTISTFIDAKNAEYFESEQGLAKPKVDTRIHLCIYMVPTDQMFDCEKKIVEEISKKCNFLPIVAKCDSFTTTELLQHKETIKKFIEEKNVSVFMPITIDEDDKDSSSDIKATIDKYPLAIFSSTDIQEVNGDSRRGRLYKWGFLDITDEGINDFMRFRRMILQDYLDDLVFLTDSKYYNEYRKIHMHSEQVDEKKRRNRLIKIKNEMEKIINERNRFELQKIENEMLALEKLLETSLNINTNADNIVDNQVN